jgi:hypothetical protein
MRVANGNPLGRPVPLTVTTVNYVGTMKVDFSHDQLSER